MQLEPHERRGKRSAVHDAAFVARRRIRIAQMPLQGQDLPQEFHIAPRERQNAEARTQLLRAAMMLVEQPERNEEGTEKDRIAERLRIALERAPVVVDGRK